MILTLFCVLLAVVSACLIVYAVVLWNHRPKDWHAATEEQGACCVCLKVFPAGQLWELRKAQDDTGLDKSFGGGTFTVAGYCADDCPCGKVHVRRSQPASR